MVVQILNYLSSVQPDIEENPQTKKTYRKPAPHTEPKNKYSEIQKWDVGVRFGAAFRAWKKEQESTVPKALQKGSLVALLVWQRREQSKKSEVAERVLCWRKNRRNASGNT